MKENSKSHKAFSARSSVKGSELSIHSQQLLSNVAALSKNKYAHLLLIVGV